MKINFVRTSTIAALFASGFLGLQPTAGAAPASPSLLPSATVGKSLILQVHNCHADMRYNYVPQVGDDVLHRHSGSCRPVIADSGGGHCHSDGRRHRHSGYGTVTHNHYGRSCQVDVWRERRNPGNARGCVKVGPVTFCP